MKALVTGGTGFIGSNIVKALLEKGWEVDITGSDAEQPLPGFKGKYFQPSLLGINWDALGSYDVVFHQAAINNTTNMDKEEMLLANVASSKRLFEEVVKKGCKRIVFASSTAIYGDAPAPYKEEGPYHPLNPYAESKLLQEEIARKFQQDHTDVILVGLRYCNVYGPGESHKGKRASMIHQLALQMRERDPRIFRDGEQKRDYIYVKDVVAANLLGAEAKESCVVNCGYGTATTFNEIIRILNKVLNVDRKPIYIDNPYADRYQNHTECDMTLAKEKLGFVPAFSPEQGIKDFLGNKNA